MNSVEEMNLTKSNMHQPLFRSGELNYSVIIQITGSSNVSIYTINPIIFKESTPGKANEVHMLWDSMMGNDVGDICRPSTLCQNNDVCILPWSMVPSLKRHHPGKQE